MEEVTVRTARVSCPGGKELRLVRWAGEHGGHLDVSVRWPEAPLGKRSEDSVRIPSEVVPELVELLQEIEASEP